MAFHHLKRMKYDNQIIIKNVYVCEKINLKKIVIKSMERRGGQEITSITSLFKRKRELYTRKTAR